MKKTIVVLVAALSIAAFAYAQEPERGAFMRHPGMGREDIVAALNLSTDQKVQWDAIHSQLEASILPLVSQHRAAEDQLNSSANASSPDATEVGRAYLAMRAVDKQIRAAHDATQAKVAAILTPDQKAKFDAIHAKMDHGEQGPMMMKMPFPGEAHE